MSITLSTMLELGTAAPDFQLPDLVSGKMIGLSTFAEKKALLVAFTCRHCEFAQHVQYELAALGKDYSGSLGVVAISANDPAQYAEDKPNSLREMAVELNFTFPFCYDETQATAKAYSAACTPDFFLFGEDGRLVYRGQLDDSRPGNRIPVTGRDMRAAIDAVLSGQPVNPNQKPSLGCNIKWRPGNEPNYFRYGGH